MAASFPRPDPSSPASIAEASFNTTRRGFATDEVQVFLRAVSAELGRLQERERQLQAELALAKEQPTQVDDLDEAAITRLIGDETVRVLQTARESATLIRTRAEENASRLVSEANDEANRVRQEIDLEVSRKRKDAASDAEAEVAMAKQQGREMVNEARSYRERVLSDLDRRTKLARQQIEELAHGRDRLLQVFERARLVAVDVTSELQALDGPDELVNLSPTTGPVPLMVPRRPLAKEVPAGDVLDHAGDRNVPEAAELEVDENADDLVVDDVVVDDLVVDDVTGDDAEDELALVDSIEIDGSIGSVDTAIDGDDPVDLVLDAADDDADDEVAANGTAPIGHADGNVVNLFRGRVVEPTLDVAETDSDTDTTPVDTDGTSDGEAVGAEVDDVQPADRADVGGIFERLRHAQEAAPAVHPVAASEAIAIIEQVAIADLADEVGATDDAAESTAFTRRDEATVPLIVGAARKLKRVLADEQNGVLDALRSDHAVASIDALLPDVDAHNATYLAVLDEDLVDAAVAGAGEVGVADTVALHATLRRAGATSRAQDLVRSGLVESLRGRLERCIAEGDGDNSDVTRRVRAVYREWKTQHIDDQLDDIFRFAYAGGLTGMIEPATRVVWALDPSRPPCADCEDNSLLGAIAVGDEFPTGHTAAPAHPGCRCLTLPAAE